MAKLADNIFKALPYIEDRVESLIKDVLKNFKKRTEYEIENSSIDLLKSKILNCCTDFIKIGKFYKHKRVHGKNVDTHLFPGEIWCKRAFHRKKKAGLISMLNIPLTNQIITESSHCSWDSLNRKIINIVIPNDRFNIIIKFLRKRNSLLNKFLYHCNEKSVMVVLVIALVVSIALGMFFRYLAYLFPSFKFLALLFGMFYDLIISLPIALLIKEIWKRKFKSLSGYYVSKRNDISK